MVPAFASASRRSGVRSAGAAATPETSNIKNFRSARAGSRSSEAYTWGKRTGFPSTVEGPPALSGAGTDPAAGGRRTTAQARRITRGIMAASNLNRGAPPLGLPDSVARGRPLRGRLRSAPLARSQALLFVRYLL